MKKRFFLFFSLVFCLSGVALSADIVEIHSPSMDRTLYASVVVPASYDDHDEPLPVIYLLHGATGDHTSWLEETPEQGLIQRLADVYQMIFVLPDGDPFSFYIDSPWNPESQFETHFTQEVIPFIDNHYRTIADRNGRAITGLSMGGHGALYLSARNPELFAAAGSMSGAVDIDVAGWDIPEENIRGFLAQMGQALGQEDLEEDFLSKHSVTNLVDRMKENGIPLIIDCGIDDFLLDANRELNSRLLEAGVPHDYVERPGAHTWEYWGNALPYHVLFISRIFRSNAK